jgi:UDP-N-acetylglucosamine 2-epimerase (non-hydrolysing)
VSPRKHIYVVGNTIVDAVYKWRDKAENAGLKLLKELELAKYDYALVTVHRAENTDDPDRLSSILIALNELSKKVDVVYPMHPRTLKKVREWGLEKHLDRIRMLKPLGYLEFLGLLMHARVVLTDSGGVQEEAFTLKVPTLTLRYNTERPETTLFGINMLAGTDSRRIVELALIQAQRFEEIKSLKFDNPLGDGRAGERIVKILIELQAEKFFMDPDLSRTPFATYRLIDKNSFNAETLVCFDDEGTPILEDSESCSRRLVRGLMRLEGALP